MSWTYFPKTPSPKSLDIVWCHFPEHPYTEPLSPGLKPRPGLVRSVAAHPETGQLAVEVAYGTSKMNRVVYGNLFITQIADMKAAGLQIATRFDLSTVKRLPWAAEFFTPRNDGKGSIIGHLSPESQRYLKLLRAKLFK